MKVELLYDVDGGKEESGIKAKELRFLVLNSQGGK
jgi:hypothetical protein